MNSKDSKNGVRNSKRVVVETVPWYNKHEYEEVFKNLYSKNVFDMRWAVDRVNVWESRSDRSLATGIEATAALVRAVIQDELHTQNTSIMQPPDLVLMYSAAIIRFTNIVSEHAQGYAKKLSVRQTALEMGIPEWIIDIRHGASHSRVPSLKRLRSAAAFALDYLRREYWEKEVNLFSDYIRLKSNKVDEIETLLSSFQSLQFELMFNSAQEKSLKKRQRHVLLRKMRTFLTPRPKDFLDVFVKPGIFLPSAGDLADILKHENETSFIDNKTTDLPKVLEEFWFPVIITLARKNALQEFLEVLLESLSTDDELHQKVAASWIMKFIHSDREKLLLPRLPDNYQPSFNWFRLLGACVHNCCGYTPALLPIIFDHIEPKFSEDKKNRMMALVAINLGASAPDSNNVSHSDRYSYSIPSLSEFFTVQQLKEDLKIRSGVPDKPGTNKWFEPEEDIDWSTIPIGTVFGNLAEFTDNIPPAANFLESDASSVLAESLGVEQMQNDDPNWVIDQDIDVVRTEVTYDPKKIQIFPSGDIAVRGSGQIAQKLCR